MDRITLRGIRAYGRHGADPGERERAQMFEIELSCDLDARGARENDDLDATLDYAALHRRVVALVAEESHRLLERLAQRLLDLCFEDSRVREATVRIEKPALLDGSTPGVTCSQRR
ncbi:MAG: dihydroneopterin aldolase [Candidatus Eremiobacteraeota bacterium]|uniref:dihydroneopterin aldolase n=1 Tax=mine drainage metagenome TaxID=410659 RepID=E6PIG3_9ZZZZ|nr:dihydroneopterin aldolase [Candidatus Eremiobacteraeota bacterium]